MRESVLRRRAGRLVGAAVGLLMLGSVASLSAPGALESPARAAAPAAGAAQPAAIEPSSGFAEVAKAVRPAVVNITPAKIVVRERERRSPFGFRFPFDPFDEFFGMPEHRFGPQRGEPMDQAPRPRGMGSGVLVSPDGYIITNDHVVEGAKEVQVTLPDKREFVGKVIGTDPRTDLAVVKIDGKDLPYVPWGDSSKLQVGEYVLAVGNPFGLNSTVTLGIVSALGRDRMGITQYEDFIQTDAAINPGNSGGALVNTRGELIGINTAIVSRTGGYQGVGFAVPSSMAKPVYESLVKTGKVVRGYLGVAIQDLTPELAQSFGLKASKGALVSDVTSESPAERAGLKQGDVIVEYQGNPVEDPGALQRAVTRTPVGTKATLKVIRDGREQEIEVTIAEQPETVRVASTEESEAEGALAGVEVRDLDRRTARELGLSDNAKGVVVMNVDPESHAAQAGLTEGDVIQEINRKPVRSVKDFEKIAAGLKKDQPALLLINRRGASLFLAVRI